MYTSADLARSFRTVRKNTLLIAHDIPADKWSFHAAPGARTIAELFAHIATLTRTPQQLHLIDEKTFITPDEFRALGAENAVYEKTLKTPEAIIHALEENGEDFARRLEALTPAQLAAVVNFPPPLDPPSKTRFELLLGVKEHEMHHRGQLMLLQRMVGVVPHLTRQRQAHTPASPAVH
jgi:uncharacterized damage-inducible protein DinB